MKLSLFQKYLNQEKIDLAFLVDSEKSLDPTVTYLTQEKFSHSFLLITSSKADLYLTKLDNPPKISKIKVQNIPKNWCEKFSSNAKKIGINKKALTVFYLDKLKKIYPKARFVDVSAQIDALRSSKRKKEIELISHACKVTTSALQDLIKEFPKKTLKTEQEVAFFIEKYFRTHECSVAFPTIVAMSKNAAIPHHVTGNTKLTKGFLLIDFGASFNNYNSDCTRVLFLGKPDKQDIRIYKLLQDAQKAALLSVKSGVYFEELDKVARKVLGTKAKYFTHSLGHGIGVEVHEAPVFSDKKQKVSKNCVFTIEPGIYVPGKLGLRIEDTVVFDGKVKVLTKFTKDLISVPRF